MCVCVNLSALSDHRPGYKNNDSGGCALQDRCIVLAGKPPLATVGRRRAEEESAVT